MKRWRTISATWSARFKIRLILLTTVAKIQRKNNKNFLFLTVFVKKKTFVLRNHCERIATALSEWHTLTYTINRPNKQTSSSTSLYVHQQRNFHQYTHAAIRLYFLYIIYTHVETETVRLVWALLLTWNEFKYLKQESSRC